MTKPATFSQATIKRAIAAAEKIGMKAVLREDGIHFEKPTDDPQGAERLEKDREIVL